MKHKCKTNKINNVLSTGEVDASSYKGQLFLFSYEDMEAKVVDDISKVTLEVEKKNDREVSHFTDLLLICLLNWTKTILAKIEDKVSEGVIDQC